MIRRVVFADDEIRCSLGAINEGKHPEPNKLNGKLQKSIMGSDELVKRLMQAYNGVMDSGVVPEGWRKSAK